jgi:ParB-like chromosome segregation protein Spo0J
MRAVRFAKGVQPLLVPIEQVRQHPENPNNGDDEAVMESVQVNGFYTAVTADPTTGYIIAGNTRYRVLHALNATHIPVIWEDVDADGQRRILVGDNKLGKLARIDDAAQVELLKKLQETELGLMGSGFTDETFAKYLNDLELLNSMPMGDGFGQGQPALNGIYQVVLEFEDEDSRDEAFAYLHESYSNVRTVNL